jgi:hypothetical protein
MPFVCRSPQSLVYVHIPKTGGTQSREILRAHGGRKEGRGHDSIRVVPYALRRDSLCVATLRDPWTWYASWYEHARRLGDEGLRLLRQWSATPLDFESVLYGLTHPYDLPAAPKRPGVVFVHDASYPRSTAPHGLLSWCWRYFCCERDGTEVVDVVIDTASLTEGWSQVLGVDVKPGKANQRPAGVLPTDYAAAYTPEMVGWVHQADAPLIQRFGFEPFAPLRSPVVHLETLAPPAGCDE